MSSDFRRKVSVNNGSLWSKKKPCCCKVVILFLYIFSLVNGKIFFIIQLAFNYCHAFIIEGNVREINKQHGFSERSIKLDKGKLPVNFCSTFDVISGQESIYWHYLTAAILSVPFCFCLKIDCQSSSCVNICIAWYFHTIENVIYKMHSMPFWVLILFGIYLR